MQLNALVLNKWPLAAAQCPVIDIACSTHQLDCKVKNNRLRNKEA